MNPLSSIPEQIQNQKSVKILKDPEALSFWKKIFDKSDGETPIIVAQSVFQESLQQLLKNHKKTYASDFSELVSDRIFVPLEPEYWHKFITQECVQEAINIFGPWPKIFGFLNDHFFDSSKTHRPIDHFYHRCDDTIIQKTLETNQYLLRYSSNSSKSIILSDKIAHNTKIKTTQINRNSKGRKKKWAAFLPNPDPSRPASKFTFFTLNPCITKILAEARSKSNPCLYNLTDKNEIYQEKCQSEIIKISKPTPPVTSIDKNSFINPIQASTTIPLFSQSEMKNKSQLQPFPDNPINFNIPDRPKLNNGLKGDNKDYSPIEGEECEALWVDGKYYKVTLYCASNNGKYWVTYSLFRETRNVKANEIRKIK